MIKRRLLFQFTVGLFVASICIVGFALSALAVERSQQLRVERLEIMSGEKTHVFDVEVAATDRERAQGLMFREEMQTDHGMLFVFEAEGDRYFWMKNTPLPLDILYIDSVGKIVSIVADTTPYSETVLPSGAPARFVLELNSGTAEKLDITAGDQVSSASMVSE